MARRLLAGLLLLNALALAWIALDLADSKRSHEEQARVASRNMAQALDQRITASTEKIDLVLQTCVDFLEQDLRLHKSLSAAPAAAFFQTQRQRVPELAAIRASDASGRVLLGVDVHPQDKASWASREFFASLQAAPDRGLVVTGPLLGMVTKRWVVAFARRYNHADGSFAGVVSASVPLEYLEQLLSSMDMGRYGSAVLRDSTQGLIARYPRVEGAVGEVGSKSFSPELAAVFASGERTATYRAASASDGVERINTYRRLGNVPFHLLAGIGAPDYLRDFKRDLGIAAAQALLFLLVTASGAWIIWRAFLRAAQEHERSSALLRGASDGIHVLDAQGNLVEASDSFFAMLGYTRNEGMVLNVRDWDAHYPHAQLGDIIQSLLLEGRSSLMSRHRRKDGTEFPVEVSVLPLTMHGRRLLFASARDITDRKLAEQELELSHELFNKISEQVPGVLFQFCMDAQGRFSVPFASKAGAELFGLDSDTVRSDAADVFAVVLPADRKALIAAIQQSARTLQDWQGEFRVELPGQGLRWRLGQARPERQSDGSILWHGFIADATERIVAQNQLRELNESLERRVHERTQELALALQSAEMANRSRGEFLANTSHEIRTPMNSVLGMVYLALKTNTDPQQRQYLERIQRAGVHLMRIIDDILDFSKIDAGKLQLEIAGFSLEQALQQVLHLTEGRAQEKGLSLHLEKEATVPALLQGDALRIEQILLNFVNNAIKFTERGSVVLAVHCLQRSAAQCTLRFEVRDTGVGLSAEALPRLFQSFEQGDKTTTRRFGGTGLGLAISRQLAHLMGGEVGVSSQPGVGSSFWFQAQFPLAEAVALPPDDHAPMQQAMAVLRGTSMLVVDDNEFNLDVARGLLEDLGVQVRTAANGEQALELLHQARYDCVLMDVQMPVMD
ncbi:MAG: PAS domain S-box protein, partial [Rhodoferax sp.]|nr:PAS domain S-box protein [Rhodoferax sp.]